MPLPPGAHLGPYEILAALDAGGMGEVYRGRDSRLGRIVAIKILPPHLASDSGFRERFAREARAISAVEHPHICALYDVGTEGGVDYLIMQYVEGETLAQRIRRGPIPVPEALALAQEIAAGLEAAHERGILHRDLKPSNIKLTLDGTVKILDFGLAKTLTVATASEDSEISTATMTALTESGVVVGTAGYMSPEQTLGRAVDRRTDVWAFACVLFEMLAGRRAFGGRTVTEVLAAVVGQEPDWTALPTTTPRVARDLLQRCLRKDPARRVRDMGDARLELEDASSEKADAPAVKESDPARRWSAIAAWGVAGIMAVTAAGLFLARPPAGRNGGRAMRFSAVTTFSGVEAQPALSPDGRSIAFVSNRDGQWDIYVGLVAGGTLVRVTNDANVEMRPRWSPDGTRLLFARLSDAGTYDLWVVPSLGGVPRRLVLDGAYPAWSPDGRTIAYSADGVLWICDASGEHPRAVTRPEPPVAHLQPSFSHDGRRLVFVRRIAGPYGELAIVDLASSSVRTITKDGALAWSPVWSPDDRFVYFASSRGGTTNVWKIPSAAGEPEQVTAGQGADSDLDLSADGKRLVFSTYRTNLNLAQLSLDPASHGRREWLTSDASRGELAPRYSPDGRRIAYFSNRSGAEPEGIWVMDANGANPSKIVEDEDVNVFPRWTADGREIVFVSRERALLAPRQFRRISPGGGAPEIIATRPFRDRGDITQDGRLIYQTTSDSGEVYETGTRRRISVAGLPGDPLWSGDGRSFAYVVRPDAPKPSDAGLWVGTLDGQRRQIFHGWVVSFTWLGSKELLALEGRPDLRGVLSRIDTEGHRTVALTDVGLFRSEVESVIGAIRFDVDPSGQRVAIEELESLEADIGLIDNVR
jgi:Tol biopolymer transport system component